MNDFYEFCRKGNLEKVKECIRQGIKPNINSNNPIFLDPIRLASLYGHLEIVKYLASFDSVDPGAKNNRAIRYASLNGHLEVVKYLTSLDSVDPGTKDNYAIRWASKYSHLEVIKYLVSIGAYRKGIDKKIDKYVIERQILIILCLNRKLNCNFEKNIYKLFMKSY